MQINLIQGKIRCKTEDRSIAQVAADIDILVSTNIASAIDLQGGQGAEEEMPHAELGSIAEGDLVPFKAAQDIAPTTREEGAAGICILCIKEYGAAEASAVDAAVSANHSVESNGCIQARIDINVPITLEVGGAFDPEIGSVCIDKECGGSSKRTADFKATDNDGLIVIVAKDAIHHKTTTAAHHKLVAGHWQRGTEADSGVGISKDALGACGAIPISVELESVGIIASVDFDDGIGSQRIGCTISRPGIENTTINFPEASGVLCRTVCMTED